MSDLGWRADGIARAKAAGGIELERYRRPGFVAGIGVRRSEASAEAQGFEHDTIRIRRMATMTDERGRR